LTNASGPEPHATRALTDKPTQVTRGHIGMGIAPRVPSAAYRARTRNVHMRRR
jgi:hypothetical protein